MFALPAGQGVQQGRGSREGLYLPRAVVQIHHNVEALKHSTHGVDYD